MKTIEKGKSKNVNWSFNKSSQSEEYSNKSVKVVPSFQGKVDLFDSATRTIKTDGLLTFCKGIYVMNTADCIPAVVWWPQADLVGLLHLNFRGLFRGLVPNFNKKIEALGCSIGECRLVLGPSICPKCYTHEGIIRRGKWLILKSKYPKYTSFIDGEHIFDLRGAYLQEFSRIGIKNNNMEILSDQYCTNCKLGLSRHHGVKNAYIVTILEKN